MSSRPRTLLHDVDAHDIFAAYIETGQYHEAIYRAQLKRAFRLLGSYTYRVLPSVRCRRPN